MAGSVGTLVDLLLFYSLERLLFNRMVQQMGKNPQLVKMAMALWLMLEEIGYYDLVRKINAFDDWTIEAVFNEAIQCVVCIQPNAVVPPSGLDDMPVFISLVDEPMNRRFFFYNRQFMHKRFTHIMESVCNKIFGEHGALEVDQTSMRPVVRPFGDQCTSSAHEGASSTGTDQLLPVASSGAGADETWNLTRDVQWTTHSSTILNPSTASDQYVHEQAAGDDNRTMFLTFSKGFPLTRKDVFDFFTSKWGNVVEEVVVEQAAGGQAPLYGRIIFKTSSIIPIILNGQARAKFMVGRKHLWARIYVPRR